MMVMKIVLPLVVALVAFSGDVRAEAVYSFEASPEESLLDLGWTVLDRFDQSYSTCEQGYDDTEQAWILEDNGDKWCALLAPVGWKSWRANRTWSAEFEVKPLSSGLPSNNRSFSVRWSEFPTIDITYNQYAGWDLDGNDPGTMDSWMRMRFENVPNQNSIDYFRDGVFISRQPYITPTTNQTKLAIGSFYSVQSIKTLIRSIRLEIGQPQDKLCFLPSGSSNDVKNWCNFREL